MKSKYTKIKYTNSGVKAPVVTLMKSNKDLDRSDMIEMRYPELVITIKRVSRKTMYNRATSYISVCKDDKANCFYVHDTINDAKVCLENLYFIVKKPEKTFYEIYDCINTREYYEIYDCIKEVMHHVKES